MPELPDEAGAAPELAADADALLAPATVLLALETFELAELEALLSLEEAALDALDAAEVLFAEEADDKTDDRLDAMLDDSLERDETAPEATDDSEELRLATADETCVSEKPEIEPPVALLACPSWASTGTAANSAMRIVDLTCMLANIDNDRCTLIS